MKKITIPQIVRLKKISFHKAQKQKQ